MKPVVGIAEMAAIDRAAQVHTPIETLIERAGFTVAAAAVKLLGGAYGRRAIVVCGRGHNGDDGQVAARLLARRGVRVTVVGAADAPRRLPDCDLVIDAAYGTGLSRAYEPPAPPPGAAVLAVDIPSGLNADTGEATEAVVADATVTFAALKPGLLLNYGPDHAGAVTVAPIGLDTSGAHIWLVEDADLRQAIVPRPREAHKWQRAVYVCAGSPGMLGAAELSSRAALRGGAGMVRLGSPGTSPGTIPVTEAVARPLAAAAFADEVLAELDRCKCLVLGPGLGTAQHSATEVRRLVAASPIPVVLDADGLNALGEIPASGIEHASPLVLTPHDGEYARLAGTSPGADRISAACELAKRAGAVVLLKGSTTVVANGDGDVRLANSGSSRLATAGTGDVLSGLIGAFVARGLDPLDAAALAAHAHGRAAGRGRAEGLVAGDLPELVAGVLSGSR